MRKEKIIYYAGCCVIILAAMFYIFKTPNTQHLHVVLLVVYFLIIPLYIWNRKTEEKQNPLNLEKLRQALKYAAEKRYGTKSEFIQANSQVMYEHFLNRGFIHERLMLSEESRDCDPRWELTRLGEKAKKYYE